MARDNSNMVEKAADKLYKLTLSANRQRAKEQGFYTGRFMPRVAEDTKKTQYLRLRRDKPSTHNL
jgi:hypothetical protein